MLVKKYNQYGQKAYQRTDREDRSLVYRDWLRTVKMDGFFMDVDMVKWKTIDGKIIPCAITELTRCDSDHIGEAYLAAIIDRWFRRDKQADIVLALAEKLQVPAYLVCFNRNMKWVWVYSFRQNVWKQFTPYQWAEYLKAL